MVNEEENTKKESLFNISQEMVLKGIKKYTGPEQDLLLWFVDYIRNHKHGSKDAACELLQKDWTTVSRIYKGRYGASITAVIKQIEFIKRSVPNNNTDFIATPVTRRIEAVINIAKEYRKMVLITGDTGRSKTHTVKEWITKENSGKCIYIDTPATGSARAFLEEFGRKIGIKNDKISRNRLISRIESSIDHRNIIIVDEASRLLPKTTTTTVPIAIEFLRRLHDTKGCAVVFIATTIFEKEMEFGSHKAYMEQILGRLEEVLDIPSQILKSEVVDICKAFTANPSEEMYKTAYRIASNRGKIRLLFTLLKQAAAWAEHENEELNDKHLVTAERNRHQLLSWD